MKKTLIPGMFSSISDAELVTKMMNTASEEEDAEPKDSIKTIEGKKNNGLSSL